MRSIVYLVLILVMVVAAGSMAFSALRRSARGEIRPESCASCGAPLTRAYPACKRCGAETGR